MRDDEKNEKSIWLKSFSLFSTRIGLENNHELCTNYKVIRFVSYIYMIIFIIISSANRAQSSRANLSPCIRFSLISNAYYHHLNYCFFYVRVFFLLISKPDSSFTVFVMRQLKSPLIINQDFRLILLYYYRQKKYYKGLLLTESQEAEVKLEIKFKQTP